jgi:hypothetical protein
VQQERTLLELATRYVQHVQQERTRRRLDQHHAQTVPMGITVQGQETTCVQRVLTEKHTQLTDKDALRVTQERERLMGYV